MPTRAAHTLAIASSLVLLSGLASPNLAQGQAQDDITTVLLVRHSEKEDEGRDPSLSVDGRKRAQALAHVLGEMNIGAIYATQFARTQETAQPLADQLAIPVTVVEAAEGYARDMARMIRTKHQGDIVVVVSHSNTVPGIIAALGGTPVPAIDEDEYDDLYLLTLSSDGTHVLNLRYGRETP